MTSQRGDSIIEVLLAITIFSLVSVGSLTIMNQGTNTSQRALEITQVRHQIDAQAEALRASQQAATTLDPAAIAVWDSIIGSGTSVYNETTCPTTAPTGSFIMDGNRATKLTGGAWFGDVNSAGAPPYAQVIYDGSGIAQRAFGMWIERDTETPSDGVRAAYSFAINACWNGAGSSNVPQRLRTVVRLYDPS